MSIDSAFLIEREIAGERFKFLVVDQPEKWETAADISVTFRMPIPGTQKVLELPCKGISFEDYIAVSQKFPYPSWSGDGPVSPEVKKAQEICALERRLCYFELATGIQVPGKTIGEKRDHLNRSNPASMDAIGYFISRELCNSEEYKGVFLTSYAEMLRRFPEENVTVIESFESFLSESTNVIHTFRTNRSGQVYIVEFPLKGLTAEQKEEIEKQTPEPTPPMIPAFHPVTRQAIPGRMVANLDDPSYVRAVNRTDKRRTLLYLNVCLPFKIPGENEEAQLQWLGLRLIGDVRQISSYITNVILGVEGRYNFF